MNSTDSTCARGHVNPVWEQTATSRECRDCRRLRQTSPRALFNKRRRCRDAANDRDLTTLKEILRAQA